METVNIRLHPWARHPHPIYFQKRLVKTSNLDSIFFLTFSKHLKAFSFFF